MNHLQANATPQTQQTVAVANDLTPSCGVNVTISGIEIIVAIFIIGVFSMFVAAILKD